MRILPESRLTFVRRFLPWCGGTALANEASANTCEPRSPLQLPDRGLPTVTGVSCQLSGNNACRLRTLGMS